MNFHSIGNFVSDSLIYSVINWLCLKANGHYVSVS